MTTGRTARVGFDDPRGLKRNRFVTWTGGTKTINRDLEAKLRALAGWKPYVTNLQATPHLSWVATSES